MNRAELKLPQHIANKAIKSGNEYGWKKDDVLDVIAAARTLGLAVIGGQVQYLLPGATCELYWRSYDSDDRKAEESWMDYCDRAALECSEKFKVVSVLDLDKEVFQSFNLDLKLYHDIKLPDYQVFILYFREN